MMKFLRKKGVMKTLLWFIAGVIILSFGVFSNAYLLSEKSEKIQYAGKLFGKKVSVDKFESNYQYTVIQARLQYGQNFDQVAPNLQLEQQTWDRLILLEEAKRERIKVSDDEVIQSVSQFPFFRNQQTGRFDPKIYQMVLRQGLHTTTRGFEEGLRGDLQIKKLFERQTFALSVSDEETLETYKKFNEKIRVSYVLFPIEDFAKKVEFNEIGAKNYFLEHKRELVQPAAINIFYISFPFEKDNEESKNAAYDKAFNALSELHNGKEFSEVASAMSLKIQESGFFDIQKPNLSLGWPLETFQKLFSMRQGQYADIVTTENHLDILQLHDIRPPFLPTYEQAKEDLKAAFLNDEALKMSEKKATEIQEAFSQDGDFNATAQAQGLTVKQIPDFTFGQYLPDIGIAPAFQQAAFSLTKESPVSPAVETEKGYAIIHLDERLPVDMEKYEQEKTQFSQKLLMRKKMLSFNDYVEKLQDKAKIEDKISEYLKK